MRWLILSSFLWCASTRAEPMRALVLDGFSDHDWRQTTRIIGGILPREEFTFEVTTSPPPDASPQAWATWSEYDRMSGLRWRGNEFGPALKSDDHGQVVVNPGGQGQWTSHGARTDRIIHRLGDHPIRAVLPRRWKTPLIEVDTYARRPAENLTALSWTEDPATRAQ